MLLYANIAVAFNATVQTYLRSSVLIVDVTRYQGQLQMQNFEKVGPTYRESEPSSQQGQRTIRPWWAVRVEALRKTGPGAKPRNLITFAYR